MPPIFSSFVFACSYILITNPQSERTKRIGPSRRLGFNLFTRKETLPFSSIADSAPVAFVGAGKEKGEGEMNEPRGEAICDRACCRPAGGIKSRAQRLVRFRVKDLFASQSLCPRGSERKHCLLPNGRLRRWGEETIPPPPLGVGSYRALVYRRVGIYMRPYQ